MLYNDEYITDPISTTPKSNIFEYYNHCLGTSLLVYDNNIINNDSLNIVYSSNVENTLHQKVLILKCNKNNDNNKFINKDFIDFLITEEVEHINNDIDNNHNSKLKYIYLINSLDDLNIFYNYILSNTKDITNIKYVIINKENNDNNYNPNISDMINANSNDKSISNISDKDILKILKLIEKGILRNTEIIVQTNKVADITIKNNLVHYFLTNLQQQDKLKYGYKFILGSFIHNFPEFEIDLSDNSKGKVFIITETNNEQDKELFIFNILSYLEAMH